MIPKATKTYTQAPNCRGADADKPQTPELMQLYVSHLQDTEFQS